MGHFNFIVPRIQNISRKIGKLLEYRTSQKWLRFLGKQVESNALLLNIKIFKNE